MMVLGTMLILLALRGAGDRLRMGIFFSLFIIFSLSLGWLFGGFLLLIPFVFGIGLPGWLSGRGRRTTPVPRVQTSARSASQASFPPCIPEPRSHIAPPDSWSGLDAVDDVDMHYSEGQFDEPLPDLNDERYPMNAQGRLYMDDEERIE